jgi:hypothetical protein
VAKENKIPVAMGLRFFIFSFGLAIAAHGQS